MNNALVDRLQIWGFEDGIAIFKDKSLGFGFQIAPQDISCESNERINQIKGQLKLFLGSLPSNIDLQFVQAIEKGGKEDLDAHLALASEASELVQQLTQERFEKFSILEDSGALPSQKNLLFVRIPFDDKISSRIRVFDVNASRAKDETVQRLNQAIAKTKLIQEELGRNLVAAGFHVSSLEPLEITKMIFDTWNPGHPKGLGPFDEHDIRDRVLLSEVVKEVRGFRIGDVHHRIVTLKVLPEQTFAGMAAALMDLPFESRLFLSVHVPDQQKEIEWLKINRNMAYAMVAGKKGVSDLESEAKFQDIENLLSRMVSDGEKIFSVSLTIVLRSQNEMALDAQISHVLQVIRELSGVRRFYGDLHCF